MENFSIDAELCIKFYNKGTYNNFDDAQKSGAVYTVPSSISLYGLSGIFDLMEIVNTLQDCLGLYDIETMIYNGTEYVPVEKLLGYLMKILSIVPTNLSQCPKRVCPPKEGVTD